MGELHYCPICQTDREVKTKINWWVFLLCFITYGGALLAAVYLLYCLTSKRKCVACGIDKRYMAPPRYGYGSEPPGDGYGRYRRGRAPRRETAAEKSEWSP